MAKIQIITDRVADRITLPEISDKFSAEEAERFVNVLAERLAEMGEGSVVREVKASTKGVKWSAGGEAEYSSRGGDWRDAVLDLVTRAEKLSAIVVVRVDVTELALNWAKRRREKNTTAA